MSVDNTHTKYLKGKNKKVWEAYKEALKAQNNLESVFNSFKVPKNLKEGEEFIIPARKK
jgi:hypothetical protein